MFLGMKITCERSRQGLLEEPHRGREDSGVAMDCAACGAYSP